MSYFSMILESLLFLILVTVLVLVISALPLYAGMSMLGGKASFIKVILVNLFSGVILALLQWVLGPPAWLTFIILIYFYHEFLKLKWWKAIVLWLVQGVIAFILVYLLIFFGLTATIGISALL